MNTEENGLDESIHFMTSEEQKSTRLPERKLIAAKAEFQAAVTEALKRDR